MVASNLDEAYLAFDPLKPLSGEQLQLYYVGREPNPIDRIWAILLGSPDTPDKILFTGHRGCGNPPVAFIRNEYQRSLRVEHYQQLRLVASDKQVREIHRARHRPGEEEAELALLELLHNLSALEYCNEGSWWDVHPIVASLL